MVKLDAHRYVQLVARRFIPYIFDSSNDTKEKRAECLRAFIHTMRNNSLGKIVSYAKQDELLCFFPNNGRELLERITYNVLSNAITQIILDDASKRNRTQTQRPP